MIVSGVACREVDWEGCTPDPKIYISSVVQVRYGPDLPCGRMSLKLVDDSDTLDSDRAASSPAVVYR